MGIFSFLGGGSSADRSSSKEEREYAKDLQEREAQNDKDLGETHESLDSDDDGFSSCGDSNSAERD